VLFRSAGIINRRDQKTGLPLYGRIGMEKIWEIGNRYTEEFECCIFEFNDLFFLVMDNPDRFDLPDRARVGIFRADFASGVNGFVEDQDIAIDPLGGSRDEKSALNWFKRAAAQKNIVAQNRLARMYYYGVGTKADIVKAGAWHVLARRAGFSDSQMDQHFSKLKDIDKRRAIELANRLSQ